MWIENIRQTPHNYDIEKNVISCIIIDNDLYYTAKHEWVDDEYFYLHEHKKIWNTIEELKQQWRLVDTVALLAKTEWLDDMIYDLSSYAYTTSWFATSLSMLKDLCIYRRIAKTAEVIWSMAHDKRDISEIMWLVKTMWDISIVWDSGGVDVVDSITEYLSNMWEYDDIICKYWYRDMDNMCQWFKKWQLVILAGRPWISKTTTALNFADKAAKQWKDVLFFSMEMNEREMTARLLSSWTGIWANKIGKEVDRMDEIANIAVENMWDRYSLKFYTKLWKFQDITNEIRKQCIKWNVDIVFIDYLWLMTHYSKVKTANMNNIIGEMTRELKQIAMEYGVCMIVLSQLNRTSAKEWKRPTLTDLRDSWNIEQDADNVYLLYRWDFDTDNTWKTHVELIVAKQRNGWQWSVLFEIVPETMTILTTDQIKRDLLL